MKILPTRKRSFLLFEVIIALTLFLTALFPFIRSSTALHRAERKMLEEIAYLRLAEETFAHLKIAFYEDNFPEKTTFRKDVKGKFEDGQIVLKKGKRKNISRTYSITPLEKYKKTPDGFRYLLLEVEIALQERASDAKYYYYPLFVMEHEKA